MRGDRGAGDEGGGGGGGDGRRENGGVRRRGLSCTQYGRYLVVARARVCLRA